MEYVLAQNMLMIRPILVGNFDASFDVNRIKIDFARNIVSISHEISFQIDAKEMFWSDSFFVTEKLF